MAFRLRSGAPASTRVPWSKSSFIELHIGHDRDQLLENAPRRPAPPAISWPRSSEPRATHELQLNDALASRHQIRWSASLPQLLRGQLGEQRVDHHAGRELEAGGLSQARQDVDVPNEVRLVRVSARGAVE